MPARPRRARLGMTLEPLIMKPQASYLYLLAMRPARKPAMLGRRMVMTVVLIAISIVSDTSRSCSTEMKKEINHACRERQMSS